MQHLPRGLLRQRPIRGTCSLLSLSLSQLLKLRKMDLQDLPSSSSF
jgi:hypothetical protein